MNENLEREDKRWTKDATAVPEITLGLLIPSHMPTLSCPLEKSNFLFPALSRLWDYLH